MSSSLIRARSLGLQQPRTRKPIRLWSFLSWFFLLTAGGVFCLWTCLSVRIEEDRIAKIREELTDIRLANSRLRGEVGMLESPERLLRIAQEQFGLKLPEPSQVVSLRNREAGKELSVAQP